MKLILVSTLCLLGAVGYVKADCYPGDTVFNSILQDIYNGVTTNNIVLTFSGPTAFTRYHLCLILTNNHNNGKITNAGMFQTNGAFLGQQISYSSCVTALTNTIGYSWSDWNTWEGHYLGKWYAETGTVFDDDTLWETPTTKIESGRTYYVQKVTFHSPWRVANCHSTDSTGATCLHGWNQSGVGVSAVWGWDRKDDECPEEKLRGRRGTRLGLPFTQGSASCIVWITTEEAFLDCITNGRRTSTASGPSRGYGQWYMS